jgi:hypothetical protein
MTSLNTEKKREKEHENMRVENYPPTIAFLMKNILL